LRGSFIQVVSVRRRSRSGCRRGVSASGPKTARITTSRVMSCIFGQSANGSPTGQRAISARATWAIISASAWTALPWKEGSINLRLVMCSGSSSNITERGPSSGPSNGLAVSTPTARPAVKTFFTSSGSLRITQSP
jgi:hypothetical protein